MDITLIETNKGKKSIVCDGYRYRIDVELKSGEIPWRCTSKGCNWHVLQKKIILLKILLPPLCGEQGATDFVWQNKSNKFVQESLKEIAQKG